jgi:biopolymer transport protein ExbB
MWMTDAARVFLVMGLLWALSVSSWVVIGYKSWWLWRVGKDLPLARQAFWASGDVVQACQTLRVLDRQAVLTPLLQQAYPQCFPETEASTPCRLEGSARLMGVLQALRQVSRQVNWGQSWLACVAAAAPFVGLLGTVWGLMDALGSLSFQPEGDGSAWVPALSHVLHLTAAGLMVALPALLAHHLLAPPLEALQQAVEDFAQGLMVQLDQERGG